METFLMELIIEARNVNSSFDRNFLLHDIDLVELPIYDGEVKGLETIQREYLQKIEELDNTTVLSYEQQFVILEKVGDIVAERLQFAFHNPDKKDLIDCLISMMSSISVFANTLSRKRKTKTTEQNGNPNKLQKVSHSRNQNDNKFLVPSSHDSTLVPPPMTTSSIPPQYYPNYSTPYPTNYPFPYPFHYPNPFYAQQQQQQQQQQQSITNIEKKSQTTGKQKKRQSKSKIVSNNVDSDSENDDTTEASEPEINNLCMPLNDAEVKSLLDDLNSKLDDETIVGEVLLILGHEPGEEIELDVENLEPPKARTLIKYFEKLRKVQKKKNPRK